MPSCALLADVYARADGKSDHIEDIRSHRISLVYAPDVVSAVLACINTGPPTYGQAMHIAQIEAPTIAEYYQIVADALNSLREEGKVPGLKGAEKKRKQANPQLVILNHVYPRRRAMFTDDEKDFLEQQ